MSEIFLQHKKRNYVSPSGHNNVYLRYKHPLKTKSFDLSIFCSERRDAIFYVTIAMEIFSFVTIFTCEEIMFSRETSSGISLLFI